MSSTGAALVRGSASDLNWFFANDTLSNASGRVLEELKLVGESRKSSDHDFVDDNGSFEEPLASNWAIRFCCRGRADTCVEEGKRLAGILSKATDGRVRSSRSSLIVNAAYISSACFISWRCTSMYLQRSTSPYDTHSFYLAP